MTMTIKVNYQKNLSRSSKGRQACYKIVVIKGDRALFKYLLYTLQKSNSNHVSFTLPYVWLLTSSVSSTTSKQCFEQPSASFLVCSLIFIEY